MSVREHFAIQLATAAPVTIDQIVEMRANRRATMNDEQYEASLISGRLATDELVGKTMLYFMLRTHDAEPQEGFDRSAKLEVLRIIDDELDQLTDLKFDRMSNAIPIFESNQ